MRKKLRHIGTNIVEGVIRYKLCRNRVLIDGDWNDFTELKDAVVYLLAHFKPESGVTYEIVENSPRLAYVYR